MVAVLRTYATEFDDDARSVFRATGDDAVDGRVGVAGSEPEARERLRSLVGVDDADGADVTADVDFDVERLG